MRFLVAEFLMCAPDYYNVTYNINPWMEDSIGKTNQSTAQTQWLGLVEVLQKHGATIRTIDPVDGLPDMVFTANGGVVRGSKVVVGTFRYSERQGETEHFDRWFQQNQLETYVPDTYFEGAGDALLDRGDPDILWVGHGFRSNANIIPWVQTTLDVCAVSLRLASPQFYHIDTCFCPLAGGHIMYHPAAFDSPSQKVIKDVVAPNLITVNDEDALNFCCNAVNIDDKVILHKASDDLKQKLRRLDYEVIETPLSEFLLAGGSAKCLTLRLDEPI